MPIFSLAYIQAGDLTRQITIPNDLTDQSGLSFDNVIRTLPTPETVIDDGAKDYPAIEIDNNFGLGGILMSAVLEKHTSSCGNKCLSEFEITTTVDSRLVDSVKFETINSDGSTIEEPIMSYQFYIRTSHVPYDKEDYGNVCTLVGYNQNGTVIEECNSEVTGTHTEYQDTWIPYNYEVMPAGTYVVKLEGNKDSTKNVDWIMTSQGKVLDAWSIWGATYSTWVNLNGGFEWNNSSYWSGLDAPSGIRITTDGSGITKFGTYVLSSYNPDSRQGTVTSNNFIITGNITVGSYTGHGGLCSGGIYVGCNGTQTVAFSDGDNILYNMMPWLGQSACIKFVDGSTAGGGWLAVDEINMTNNGNSITLNSPSNGTISNLASATFNVSVVMTQGTSMTNASLYDTSTGIWKLNKTNVITGTTNTTIFTNNYNIGSFIWGIRVCDNQGTCGWSSNRTYTYDPNAVVFYSDNHNTSTYETAREDFFVNATGMSNVNLVYSGTSYPATITGNNATAGFIIPASTGNKSYFWSANNGAYNSTTYYQYVNPTIFSLCNSTNNVPYLNMTFKDETTLDNVNVSFTSSSFNYYLSDSSVSKTYVFQNNTENPSYAFCLSPGNRQVSVLPVINYVSTGYPTRTYNPSVLTLTNSTTNTLLYLLSSANGIYVTFITSSVSNTPIQNVDISIVRDIGGNNVTVGSSLTDSSGSATFFLNPNYAHTITATKTGYVTSVTNIRPTQSTYSIIMSTVISNITYTNTLEGVDYQIGPKCGIINQNSIYNAYFNVQSSIGNLVSYQFDITNKSGYVYATAIGTNAYGSNLNISFNTTGYSQVFGRYYINVGNGTYLVDPCRWYIKDIVQGNGSMTSAIKDLFNYKSDVENNYAQIFWFFLFLFLGVASLNYFTGSDIQNPGMIIIPVCVVMTLFSYLNYFTIDFTPYSTLNQYAAAVVCWCLGGGYVLGRIQSQ